jgi:hypothetical protein
LSASTITWESFFDAVKKKSEQNNVTELKIRYFKPSCVGRQFQNFSLATLVRELGMV